MQTYQGTEIAFRSTVKAVKCLLQDSCMFILTGRFCQEPVEEYFGIQRQLGRRNDNPNMAKFGYNDNTVRIQRDVYFTSGNMQGKHNKINSWIKVSDETIPKPKIRKRIK